MTSQFSGACRTGAGHKGATYGNVCITYYRRSTATTAKPQTIFLLNHHSGLTEGVPPPLVHGRALAGVPVAEAAAAHHHVIKGVVIFVLRVSALPQQRVAQSEETREVDADVGHRDQI